MHLDTSLANALQLDDFLPHAIYVRNGENLNLNLAQYIYPEEIPVGERMHIPQSTRESLVTLTQPERMQLRQYFRDVIYCGNDFHIDEIPQRARRFTRFVMDIEPRHVLGSIRSQIMGTWNRDSSWVRYEEIDLQEHDDREGAENGLELYGQVDYYIEIEVRGLPFVLAYLHRHPVDIQESGIIVIKSAAVLRREAARRNHGRRHRQHPQQTKKWVWVLVDDIKCLVGRLISDRGVYIINPVMGWVNPDLAYMAMPPAGGEIDADHDNEVEVDA